MIIAIVGIIITVIAILGGLLQVRLATGERTRHEKILMFGLYFWLLVFIQLVVVSIGYALLKR